MMTNGLRGIAYFIRISWTSSRVFLVARVMMEILSALTVVVSIVMPRFIVDELFGQQDLRMLALYAGLLLATTFVSGQLSARLRKVADTEKEVVRKHFELAIARKLMRSDLARLEEASFQDLKKRADQFVHGRWNQFGSVLESALSLIGKVLVIGSIMYLLLSVSVVVLLVFVALHLATAWVSAVLKKKRTSLISGFAPVLRRQGYYEKTASSLEFAKEIRLGGLAQWVLDTYRHYMDVFRDTTSTIHRHDLILKTVVAAAGLLQQGVAYGYIVLRAVQRSVTAGDFVMYLGAMSTFSRTMDEIVETLVAVGNVSSYYDAFEQFSDFPTFLRRGNKALDPDGARRHELTFENVSFAYPGQTHKALDRINVVIRAGETISIVGENGAGKTTFVKLLTRLYDPDEGRILLDGTDIRELDYDEYMKLFSVVFQDFKLFAVSIEENVAAGAGVGADTSAPARRDRVERALGNAGLGDRITALEKGIDTQVFKVFDGSGIEPSGGEEQKIAIARALYKNAPVVALDEPTAALDPRSERDIYRNFDTLTHEKTALYISHRLASSRFCDRILVFRAGSIVEEGTHDELVSAGGLYAELFAMQSSYYRE